MEAVGETGSPDATNGMGWAWRAAWREACDSAWDAGVSVLLCAAVLVALASQVLYAVVLSLGYACFSLWRSRRRSAPGDVCAIK